MYIEIIPEESRSKNYIFNSYFYEKLSPFNNRRANSLEDMEMMLN